MKSAPEIWQLIDDEELARAWLAELAGSDSSVKAVARRPDRSLAWRSDGGDQVRLDFALEEKGFGTQVSISSDADGGDQVLERVMEQLAEPERRPFARA